MKRTAFLLVAFVWACAPAPELGLATAEEEVFGLPAEERLPDVIRIEVLPSYRENALARFQRAGLRPQIEPSSAGNPTFVFRCLSEQDAFRAVSLLPPEYFAKRGYVGGWRKE